MSSYRQEATTRVLYLTGAFLFSVGVAVIVATIISLIFSRANHDTHYKVFGYTCFAVFAIVCSFLVYKIDQILNKRFNTNP